MSRREIPPVQDGDTGPVYRFPVRDGAGYRDMATAAVEVYVEDRDGNSLGMRPGAIVSPKSGGQVDVMLRGKESDWDGAGHDLVLIPKFYYATAPDGTAATNLLLNPSFDTDTTPADGLADSWAITGTFVGGSQAVLSSDVSPSVIFGNCQRIQHAVLTDTMRFDQSVTVATAIGDVYSAGVWHRTTGTDGSAASDNHSLELATDAGDSTFTRFKVGVNDWYFVTNTRKFTVAHASIACRMWTRGTLLNNRFDDAFLFKGTWRIFFGERMAVRAKARSRPAKTTNQIAGLGSFEKDSNSDGIADGFTRVGTGNTYTIDQDPANVSEGSKSQKVALTGAAADQYLRLTHRGKHASGETWKAQVKYKNSGALTGAPSASEFGIELRTEDFDAAFVSASTAFALASTPGFVTVSTQIVLTANANVLQIRLALAIAGGGTIWLDDLQLFKL